MIDQDIDKENDVDTESWIQLMWIDMIREIVNSW